VHCDWNSCEPMLSWSKLKFYVDWKDVGGKFHDQYEVKFGIEQMIVDDVWCHYQIWGDMWIRTNDKNDVVT
jgi:hypothetical protein